MVPDLTELSPPKPNFGGQSVGGQGTAPLSAWPNQSELLPAGQSVADILGGYNVDESTGLRGIQLAQPKRERAPVPVIHMPDREYGGATVKAPPPSLDLLGLAPVPIQADKPRPGLIESLEVGPLCPRCTFSFRKH